jgi:hypothetical protein
LRQQIADRKEWVDFEAAERARQRGLVGAERDRQRGFTTQANAALDTEIDRYTDIPGRAAARGKQIGDYFTANSASIPTSVMPAASGRTASHTAEELADTYAFNKAQNESLGNLRSVGDLFADISTESLGDKTRMTNVADFKQGSKALLPAEIRPIVNRQAPQITAGNFGQFAGVTQPDNTMSDILRGVGSIGTAVGLSGWNPFGGGSGAGGGFSTGRDGYGPVGAPRYGGPR